MAQHRIFSMAFAKVYPLYVQKAERKSRAHQGCRVRRARGRYRRPADAEDALHGQAHRRACQRQGY